MDLLYSGKTKNLWHDAESGKTYLEFTDHATGDEKGFDPGANQVIGDIAGIGKQSWRVSKFFFELFKKKGISSHYIGEGPKPGWMEVKKATLVPMEWVGRFLTAGSACRVYGVKPGMAFDPMATETMLKSDPLEDPRINQSMAVGLGFCTNEVYEGCLDQLNKIGYAVKEALAGFGLELIDFKVEFGYDEDGTVMLIDEVSAAVWRVFKDGKPVTSDESMKIILAQL